MALIQLIYVSSARAYLSDAELDSILDSSARHNKPNEISGLLLYGGGNFMQVLEGEELVVSETFKRISLDPRHREIIELCRDKIAAREFQKWSMGYRRLSQSEMDSHPEFADIAKNGLNVSDVTTVQSMAFDLLKTFYWNNECR